MNMKNLHKLPNIQTSADDAFEVAIHYSNFFVNVQNLAQFCNIDSK